MYTLLSRILGMANKQREWNYENILLKAYIRISFLDVHSAVCVPALPESISGNHCLKALREALSSPSPHDCLHLLRLVNIVTSARGQLHGIRSGFSAGNYVTDIVFCRGSFSSCTIQQLSDNSNSFWSYFPQFQQKLNAVLPIHGLTGWDILSHNSSCNIEGTMRIYLILDSDILIFFCLEERVDFRCIDC
jgi:hypothetical protein